MTKVDVVLAESEGKTVVLKVAINGSLNVEILEGEAFDNLEEAVIVVRAFLEGRGVITEQDPMDVRVRKPYK